MQIHICVLYRIYCLYVLEQLFFIFRLQSFAGFFQLLLIRGIHGGKGKCIFPVTESKFQKFPCQLFVRGKITDGHTVTTGFKITLSMHALIEDNPCHIFCSFKKFVGVAAWQP